jgi:hypothetical protein
MTAFIMTAPVQLPVVSQLTLQSFRSLPDIISHGHTVTVKIHRSDTKSGPMAACNANLRTCLVHVQRQGQ